jgi:hypothetical protein
VRADTCIRETRKPKEMKFLNDPAELNLIKEKLVFATANPSHVENLISPAQLMP